jgi:DNA invertase Pin-like site-specific DNA recombinase
VSDSLKILGYGRQSLSRPGEDQASSLSLRGQADLFRTECERRGWVSVGFITDHDLKGDDPNRPGIHELLERVRSGGVDGIWVTMLNRFSNDYIFQGLAWRNLKALGVDHLISYVEGPVEDEFILGIHGLVSGKRITELRVHLKNAFARRARDGGFPNGAAPLGYKRPNTITATRANGTTYTRETGTPEIDPAGAEIVRRIFALAISGLSLLAIASELDRDGVPTQRGGAWGEHYIAKILRNPIYVGDIAHRGIVVAHNDGWQIIDRETWQRVQRTTANRVTIRHGVDHWLEGLVYHSCGHRMYFYDRPWIAPDRGIYVCRASKWVPSIACRADHTSLTIGVLEPAVRQCLERDLANVTPADEALRIAQEQAGGDQALKMRSALDKRLAAAEARWARNHERFSEGKLPPATMDVEDARLEAERAAIAAARTALPQSPDAVEIARIGVFLRSLASALPEMSDTRLRAMLMELGTVHVNGNQISIRYGIDPFEVFIKPSVVAISRWGRNKRGAYAP